MEEGDVNEKLCEICARIWFLIYKGRKIKGIYLGGKRVVVKFVLSLKKVKVFLKLAKAFYKPQKNKQNTLIIFL